MENLVVGIVAHVDAGKTTLSESLLYECGKIRKLGRVDTKDAFLDFNSIEKERGITIFSKQAVLSENLTLIDTPGHVDFSAEMERTLAVLDAAILLVNAADGVQSHTKTLWSLLKLYSIPAVIFVNKMDMKDTNKDSILKQLKDVLGENIVDFDKDFLKTASFYEEISNYDDDLMEKYLCESTITDSDIAKSVCKRNVFPCIFGSALKQQNIDSLINVLSVYFQSKSATKEFSCRVYKIAKDKQNNRLTFLKITGGTLKVKDYLGDEKVNEIRVYSGEKYESVKELGCGKVCAVTGLKKSKASMTYGETQTEYSNKIEGALVYSVLPPPQVDVIKLLGMMKEIEEEFPELKVEYSQALEEIHIVLMGEIQTQIIKRLLHDRYNVDVDICDGRILYKETIEDSVIGVGHYEPLKHYAEVQLKLSPLERGEGLKFECNLSVDILDTNWQRLILTHLKEKSHKGVLTGSDITDMKISVIAGKAHLKHTEGGDFRQSTYRAIRQGLMKAKNILLEPFYAYELIVPENCTGRAMNDIDKMKGICNLSDSKNGFSVLTGKCPVSTMKNYVNDVRSYTKGQGTLILSMGGYDICHNCDEVIKAINYNADSDLENPSSSVFCSHGAGFVVNWDEVDNYKHIQIS